MGDIPMTQIMKYLAEAQKADALLDRAYLFLEDGEKQNALTYFEKVLDQNARSPFAYLGRMTVNIGATVLGDLLLFEESYTEHPDFQKALRFSEGELHDALFQMASERDRYATAYKKASDAERGATDIEAFVEVYHLYEDAGDYADAQDKRETILESLSVLRYYSDKGFVCVMEMVENSRTNQAQLEEQMAEISALISAEETMLKQMHEDVIRKKAELASLGWFKKKRKIELGEEIAEGEKALADLTKSIASNKKKRSSLSGEMARCGDALALEKLLGIKPSGETVEKGEATPCQEIVGVELVSFENESEPLRILKREGVLGVVAKNAMALYAMLNDEKVMKIIDANKKNASAVGLSPVFAKVATFAVSKVRKFEKLYPYLPVGVRLALEAKHGNTVTFGQFPKDGIDPYRDIIPRPGTPYVRQGTPVEWTIVKREGNTVTLICNQILLSRHYELTGRADMTWQNSEMRKYMQEEMFDLLFQGEERDIIVPMQLQMGGVTSVDKIYLPSYDEIKEIHPLLPSTGYLWTRDKIEISTYNTSLLVQVSVSSLKYKGRWDEKWHLLVHEGAGIVPVVTVKLPPI